MTGKSWPVSWSHQPMVRFLVPFCLGMVWRLPLGGLVLLISSWFIVLALFILVKRWPDWGRRPYQVFLLYALVFLCGTQLSAVQAPEPAAGISDYALLEVLPEPVWKQGRFRFDAEIKASYMNGQWMRTGGQIRVIASPSSSGMLKTGELFVCRMNPETPAQASFPASFSMKEWLAGKGISQMLRLDSTGWFRSGVNLNPLRRTLGDWREILLQRLEDAGMAKRELSVAGALILGARSEIDAELMNDFTASGLVHLLAVSGMHVGLVYGAWLLLAGLIARGRYRRAGILSAIPLIWIYAVLTGLSASVLRATVMYTLLGIASLRKTPVSPFNALASSAFLMLLHQPDIYHQAGFQLSFAAVWGIVASQTILRRCEGFQHKIVRMLAVSSAVTLAAQMATAPLGFYHFGSFPVYFFVANLLAVPLSTVLTYWGIIALFVAPVPMIGSAWVSAMEWGVRLLNNLAHSIQSLPYSRISGYFISNTEFLLSMVFLLQLAWLISRPSFRQLKGLLISLLILSLFNGYSEWMALNQSKYYATRRGKQLDVLVVKNRKVTHIQIGAKFPYANEKDVETSIGRQFRIASCQAHHRFSGERFVFKPGVSNKEPRWVDLYSGR